MDIQQPNLMQVFNQAAIVERVKAGAKCQELEEKLIPKNHRVGSFPNSGISHLSQLGIAEAIKFFPSIENLILVREFIDESEENSLAYQFFRYTHLNNKWDVVLTYLKQTGTPTELYYPLGPVAVVKEMGYSIAKFGDLFVPFHPGIKVEVANNAAVIEQLRDSEKISRPYLRCNAGYRDQIFGRKYEQAKPVNQNK